ncbi:MAG: hypothetical protein Q9224_004613, partial [Gallowayella concinna]
GLLLLSDLQAEDHEIRKPLAQEQCNTVDASPHLPSLESQSRHSPSGWVWWHTPARALEAYEGIVDTLSVLFDKRKPDVRDLISILVDYLSAVYSTAPGCTMDPGTAIAVATLCSKVVSVIWKYYIDVQDAKSNIRHLANEIQDFGQVMQKVEELIHMSPRFSASASLDSTIEQAFSDAQLLESRLDPGKTGKAMKRLGRRALTWPFTKKEVEEWVARFQRLKATVNLALTTDQSSIVLGVDTKVNQVHEGQVVAERAQQLEKLPFAASACFDSYHRQHETECIANTRVDILERLQDWGANHDRPLFWLSGMGGTGKSTVARTFANRLKSKKTLGGNFFFSRASGEANNARNLVGTLARHLATFSPVLKESISAAIASHEDVVGQGLRYQWKELIFKPLSAATLPSPTTMNVVIDALDECESDDDIRLILQLFVEVKDIKNVDLGIFVTSRPEVVIRLGFDNMPAIVHQKLDLREIPRHIVEHDILLLLDEEFDRISLQHKLQDWPSEDDKRLLVQRSDCLFIYARTACRYIGDLDWDPEERLAEIVDGSSSRGEATTQLDAMYTHVLKQALVDGQSEVQTAQLCDRFKRVVGSIVTLHDELSTTALAHLLTITPRDVEKTLSRLHSVINVPIDQSIPIRLLHPSFHDFLVDETRCRDQRFCVSEAAMHSKLARHCLRVMSSALKRNICHLQTPGSPLKDVNQEILDRNLSKHVRYSCVYWVEHLMRTMPDDRAQCGLHDNGEVHCFFQRDFLHWLEVSAFLRYVFPTSAFFELWDQTREASEVHVLHSPANQTSCWRRQ